MHNYSQIYRAVKFPRRLCSVIKSKKKKEHGYARKIVFFCVFPFFFFSFFFSLRVSRRLQRNIREKWRRQLSTCEFRCRYKILYCKTRIYVYMKRGVVSHGEIIAAWNSKADTHKCRWYHFYNDNDNGYTNANVHINNKCSVLMVNNKCNVRNRKYNK